MVTTLNYLKSGYVFNKSTNKLEEFVAKKIKFDFDKGNVIYEVEMQGKIRTIYSNETPVYADVNEFEGKPNKNAWKSCYINDACWRSYGVFQSVGWFIKDGKPTMLSLADEYIIYDVDADEFVKNHMYGKVFATEQEAIDMNEIIVVDRDGNETIHKGIGKLIQPTEEQLQVLEELKNVLSKANDCNLRLFTNYDNGIFAINWNELDDEYATYEGDINNGLNISRYIYNTKLYMGQFYDEGLYVREKQN